MEGRYNIDIFSEYKDILNVSEVCQVLGIGKNTAYKMLKSGDIKSFLIAGKYRIPKYYLIDYIKKSSCNTCA
ncbi:MAG: helix-turn-helix domain-containing protein [Clostridia bacterium]|nr:helix-turn-helix domain-containing protein [Clostridia bacterium]